MLEKRLFLGLSSQPTRTWNLIYYSLNTTAFKLLKGPKNQFKHFKNVADIAKKRLVALIIFDARSLS